MNRAIMPGIAVFWLLLSALVATAELAQPAIPNTPAGRAFAAWLIALDAADQSKLQAMITDYHLSDTADDLMGFAHQTGGFSLLKVEQSVPDAITVVVGERNSDTIARGTFTLTMDANGQVSKSVFGLRVIQRGDEFAIPRLGQTEALNAVADRAGALAANDKFSGAYLIAQDGKILAAKAYGWSNREMKTPNTLETKFRMGSMNKMFTAVAILQLVAAGRISLEGTVGEYLPDYPNKDIATKVTIRELLDHTGGTGDFFGPEFRANRLSLKTHADYVVLFGTRAPLFEPGTKDAYSNYGFLLLGNIIERVSGVSYYDYLAKNVFEPAGMADTASLPEEQPVSGRALAYMSQKGSWVSAADSLPYRGTSAGGGYTTVGDLLKFAQALQDEKLIPKRLLNDATTPHNHAGDYGYGFGMSGQGTLLQHYGHNGGAPGMNGDLIVFPALKRVVVVLSNFGPPVAQNLADFYANRMPSTP